MSVAVSLFADVIVALLLITTIVFCLKLNKRIRILQDSKSELAQLIEKFDQSTVRATHSIHEIHKASKKIAENMQARLDKANFLADDLAFMIEKGSKIADRMDGGIASARSAAGAGAASPATVNRMRAVADASAHDISAQSGAAAPTRQGVRTSGREQEAQVAASDASSDKRTPRMGVRMRSKAEQDLLEAIKAKK